MKISSEFSKYVRFYILAIDHITFSPLYCSPKIILIQHIFYKCHLQLAKQYSQLTKNKEYMINVKTSKYEYKGPRKINFTVNASLDVTTESITLLDAALNQLVLQVNLLLQQLIVIFLIKAQTHKLAF